MIDKKGRLFGRINILDLLVILVVLLGAGKLAYDRFNAGQIVNPQGERLLIQFQGDVLNQVAEVMQVGDKIYDKLTGVYLGEVVELDVSPVPVAVADGRGNIVWADSPRSSQVRLTIAADGTVTPTDYRIGAVSIRVGESRTLYGPLYAIYANTTSLSQGR
ncbi:MAG: DUF4330 domain-containing protein [Bacillota bacterium]|jgi:hypothetical protein